MEVSASIYTLVTLFWRKAPPVQVYVP